MLSSALVEAFACHDASCRPPTSGGTGGSRKGGAFGGPSPSRGSRVAPTPAFNELNKRTLDKLGVDPDGTTKQRAVKFLKTWYETDLPMGMRSSVTEVTPRGLSQYEIHGEILNKHGDIKGTFTRTVDVDSVGHYETGENHPSNPYRGTEYAKGHLSTLNGILVKHDSLELNESAQGMGIGEAFNAHSMQAYRDHGVDRIAVHAANEVGGYAWARAGFRFDDGTQVKRGDYSENYYTRHQQMEWVTNQSRNIIADKVGDFPSRIPADYDMTPHLAKLDALMKASESGEDVQPIHIASIGEDGPHFTAETIEGGRYESWAGKEMLLGTNWNGTYYLTDAVRASAAEYFVHCEHGSLVAACHDASCRPPTSGGTGGSRPGGAGKWHNGVNIHALLAHPSLDGLSKASAHERLAKDQANRLEDDLHFAHNPGLWRFHSTDALLRQTLRQTSQSEYKAMRDPNYRPTPELEPFFKAIQERLKNDDPYAEISVKVEGGGTLTNQGAVRQEVPMYARLDHDTEPAVNAVGAAIRDEIALRMNAVVDFEGERARHSVLQLQIYNMAIKADPDLMPNDISFGTYNGIGLHIQVVGRMDRPAGVEQGDATWNQMKEHIEASGFSSSNFDTYVAGKIGEEHQRITREVLADVRSMGGSLKGTPKNVKSKTGARSSHDQVIGAVKAFPSDWLEASSGAHPLSFKQTKGRAHYQNDERNSNDQNTPKTAHITLDGTHGTAVHELTHRFEYTVPGVRDLEYRFYQRRTEGLGEPKQLGKGYGKNEVGIEDNFFDKYAGKMYPDQRAYELMSMGTEALQSAIRWAKVDPDYQAFVLGTLATTYR